MLIAITTSRARSGSVGGINQNYRNPNTPCFILNHLEQLVKAPVSKLKAHLPVKAVPSLQNPTEVFKSKCLTELRRRFDKPATDVMVHPFSEPRLTTTQPLKVTLGRLRTTRLKPRTKFSHTTAKRANFMSTVLVAFRVRGKFNNAKVNPDDPFTIVNVAKWRVFHVADSHEIELTVNKAKIGLPSLPFNKPSLIFPANERDFKPSAHRPDRDNLLGKVVAQDSRIVGDRAVWSKSTQGKLVEFVRVGNLSKKEGNDLGSESRVFANRIVPLIVQVKTLKNSFLKGPLGNPVCGFVSRLKSPLQEFFLLRRSQEFDLSNEFHYGDTIIIMINPERHSGKILKIQSRELPCGSRFLPAPKGGGILGG